MYVSPALGASSRVRYWQVPGTPTVWAVVDGMKYWITDPQTVAELGGWAALESVSAAEVAALAEGGEIRTPADLERVLSPGGKMGAEEAYATVQELYATSSWPALARITGWSVPDLERLYRDGPPPTIAGVPVPVALAVAGAAAFALLRMRRR